MGVAGDAGGLCDWVAGRDRQLRWLGTGWAVAVVVTGLLALVVDAMLYLPAVPAVAGAVWFAAAWGSSHAWRARSRLAGHPVLRAEAPWSLASRRPMPVGWYEAPIAGGVHRVTDGWVWRPSRLVAADLPVLRWRADDVAASTLVPLWGPGLPPRAQLRLHLRGGATVELIVYDPDRLLVFTTEAAVQPA
jgi:hypothetical protein